MPLNSLLSDTGASLKNPFGKKSPGIFGRIFQTDMDYSRSDSRPKKEKNFEANLLNYVNVLQQNNAFGK